MKKRPENSVYSRDVHNLSNQGGSKGKLSGCRRWRAPGVGTPVPPYGWERKDIGSGGSGLVGSSKEYNKINYRRKW
ncbi:hypothetical protein V6N13_085046 [Hibiscus sabdariffa]